ncbi:peroxidase family protein [Erythrobacter sp. SD-21]|uniref:peroxidase family protein n=1 Tax=Erythrobacter sp. SD-21 TaxID=161528 RepID=UPI000154088F|nr:peroxidase family protein [Erythrobacter sp. SD-21]EDL47730.1 Animal haem peroxidase [Erythrobacter sp. SD-21]
MAVKLNKHDLEFILQQIKIAERHAAGENLVDILGNFHLPYGLRTVDGSYNNLVEGRERWGASDEIMPRMFTPNYRDDQDGDMMSFGPGMTITNTDYGAAGDVADVDPRIISNLIVDQTAGNPAAISAALTQTGYEGDATAAIQALHSAWADHENGLMTYEEFATLALDTYGLEMQGDTLVIPNTAPDEGLSSPFNAWMTYFGQFFDHGLDLIPKADNGTVYVPLQPDDPLFDAGPDGIPFTADDGRTNFMVMTRAQIDENGETMNTTTPFVDQNQTYGSHASKQVFMREYELVNGRPEATGHLLEGVNGGLATWADVKAQALDVLGIVLSDADVLALPLIRSDPYGNFIPDENGYPQVVVGIGADGIPNTADDVVVSGSPTNPVHLLTGMAGEIPPEGVPEGMAVIPVRTAHAFLDDIAHNAVPVFDEGNLAADADTDTGNAVATGTRGENLEYDNELLDRHFITGDGRGNENIALTAVHHVFHSEHNRQIDSNKIEILKSGDLAFINEWLDVDITAPEVAGLAALTDAQLAAYGESLDWDGERLFQMAKFSTEMQYQHLVFEEFGRRIQPNIDPFVFNTTTDINPAIFAEFAHVVYRFGHSMLTEDVNRMFLNDAGEPVFYDELGNETPVTDLEGWGNNTGLIEAFLNPVDYDLDGNISAEQAAGAIFRGLNREQGNHIDEFVTDALRNNLLGLPLDLAAINIARGRDTGMPTLNEARAELYDATGSTFLTPYGSWAEFAEGLKNPLSVINFIAAYGTHQTIIDAGDNVDARRAAATDLVLGGGAVSEADRLAFLNGPAAETGVNDIDMWIGGLAEAPMAFGGFLGSTFNAVFEAQMEALQDNDRFYYLSRTQGLNFLNELENNAFSKMVMANTDMTDPGPDGIRGTEDDILNYHSHVDAFTMADFLLHVDPTKQIGPDPQHDDEVLNSIGQTLVQRDDLATAEVEVNYIKFIGADHTTINGTAGDDTIIAGGGDDGIWGGAGNDRIEGGHGVDLIIAGAGNDIVTDSGDSDDFIKGDEGDDVIANSNGLDVLMGGDGKDAFIVGVDTTEVFGGEGDDFILGGEDADFLLGNEGDDWIEGGGGFDTTAGDNSELFFNSTIIGHDVMFAGDNEHDFDAESGDDIMVQGVSVMRNEGMYGFDWASYQGSPVSADADMTVGIFVNDQANTLRNRFDGTEALSGSDHDDILRGDDRGSPDLPDFELTMVNHELTQGGLNRIEGLREALGIAPQGDASDDEIVFAEGNVLFGGGGSDYIEGRGGNDYIDGDMRLHVRISILDEAGANEIATVTSLKNVVTIDGVTQSLVSHLLEGNVSPGQMHIVRELVNDGQEGDLDTAVYYDNYANYQITAAEGGGLLVTHITPTEGVEDPFTGRSRLSDGMDTVRNVEFFQFADQTISVASLNPDATGAAILSDNTPTEGQVISADVSGITDANGIVSSSIQWQVSSNGVDWVDVAGATGPDFTPEDLAGTAFGAQAGLFLRAAFMYEDGLGFDNVLYSAMTQPVGVNWEGDGLVNFIGTGGDDIAVGSAAGENLWGMEGSDNLSGGAGNDLLNGGVGADTTSGGLGNDDHHVDNAGDVVLEAVGEGTNDRVLSSATYVLNAGAEIEVLVAKGSADIDLTGNEFDNVVWGNAGANSVDGADGNDRVFGLAGDDTVEGGDGDDELFGGAGVDVSDGGLGNDTHHIQNAGDTVIEGVGQGDLDIVRSSVSWALTAGAEVEVMFAKGSGNIDLAGNEFNNTIWGNAGMNVLSGLEGDDVLFGAGAADMLFGGEGNDQLFGGVAADTMDGGLGDDIIHVNNAGDVVEEAVGEGFDQVGTTVNYVLTAGAEVEVFFAKGSGDINLTGNSLANSIWGNNGANTLQGGAGDDVIGGGAGDDTIRGGLGNDTLYGVDGNDLFEQRGALDGRDFVNGGAGIDTWQLVAGAGEDYTIYTRAEALAAGITGLNIATEIVVTLNGSDNASVIAELDNIEEIVVDSLDVASGGAANGGTTASGASVTVVGDFTPTSLDLNTITVNGGNGNDVVDITQLTSPHRIKFDASLGSDQVIGDLRPQDVVTFGDDFGVQMRPERIGEFDLFSHEDGRSDLSSLVSSFVAEARSSNLNASTAAQGSPFGQGPAEFLKDDFGSVKFAPFEDGLFETFLF